jgi:hypothetical protein
MRALSLHRRAYVLLLTSLMLVTQVAGAHVHLCLDGQSPRVQVHVAEESPGRSSANSGAPHNDELLSIAGDRSVRDAASQVDLPPALPATLVTSVAPMLVLAWSADGLTDSPPGAARLDLLPPSRGPPTTQA